MSNEWSFSWYIGSKAVLSIYVVVLINLIWWYLISNVLQFAHDMCSPTYDKKRRFLFGVLIRGNHLAKYFAFSHVRNCMYSSSQLTFWWHCVPGFSSVMWRWSQGSRYPRKMIVMQRREFPFLTLFQAIWIKFLWCLLLQNVFVYTCVRKRDYVCKMSQ